jgi:hypothetical protein
MNGRSTTRSVAAISKHVYAGLLVLSITACRTTGVEVGDEQLTAAIGMTEEQVRAEFGVPHVYSSDSDGVVTVGYGAETRKLWTIDYSSFVEFTFVEGRVTKTRRVSSRPIADKNRSH